MDLSELELEASRLAASTPTQRATLYRLGRSRYWVHKFASTKTEASRAIQVALAERSDIERRKRHAD